MPSHFVSHFSLVDYTTAITASISFNTVSTAKLCCSRQRSMFQQKLVYCSSEFYSRATQEAAQEAAQGLLSKLLRKLPGTNSRLYVSDPRKRHIHDKKVHGHSSVVAYR